MPESESDESSAEVGTKIEAVQMLMKWRSFVLKCGLAIFGFVYIARYMFSLQETLDGDPGFFLTCLKIGPLVFISIFMGGEVREFLRVLVYFAEFLVRGIQLGFFLMGAYVLYHWFAHPEEARCEPLFVAITVGLGTLEWCRIRWRKLDNSIWTRPGNFGFR